MNTVESDVAESKHQQCNIHVGARHPGSLCRQWREKKVDLVLKQVSGQVSRTVIQVRCFIGCLSVFVDVTHYHRVIHCLEQRTIPKPGQA